MLLSLGSASDTKVRLSLAASTGVCLENRPAGTWKQ
jgi:hypothetical protein